MRTHKQSCLNYHKVSTLSLYCREVKIVRLISKDTVEEAMLRCGKEKLKLEHDITTSDDTGMLILYLTAKET